MKIYLDNCCYNRPYDDQFQFRIQIETQAKLHIQDLIKNGRLDLVTSYVLDYENGKNRSVLKKKIIQEFMNSNEAYYLGKENHNRVDSVAREIMQTGVKQKDAWHLACALLADCDYFITTDDRLLKYKTSDLQIVTPVEFIQRMEVADDV